MAEKIKWSPKALASFGEICNHIAVDSEYYAKLFASKIFSIVEGIPLFPKMGRVVPEYGDTNLREKLYQNYRIVYRIKKDIIEIVAITHGARVLKNII